MVAYSFKAHFVDLISELRKEQTIRAERKRHARPGETLQLYTAMRTRQCRLIGTALCVNIASREASAGKPGGGDVPVIPAVPPQARRER